MNSIAPEPTTSSNSTALVLSPCSSFENLSESNIVRNIVKREGCLEALQQLLEAAKSPQQLVDPKALIVFRSVIDHCVPLACLSLKTLTSGSKSVAILESLRELRLTQNPFLTQMHLNHPALREDRPVSAIQIFGKRVGNVSMLRIFFVSKLLLRERDAEARCRLDRITTIARKSRFVDQEEDQASSGTAVAFTHAQEVAECEDIALSRELVTQAEHEVEAIRYDLADLQARLDSAVLTDERRWLQTRIGCLVNSLKFRSGDVCQRKNELKRKVAMYRAAKDSRGSSGDRRALARTQLISQAYVATEKDQNETIYSPLFETALLEDELMRHDFVERVNSMLLKAKADSYKREMSTPL